MLIDVDQNVLMIKVYRVALTIDHFNQLRFIIDQLRLTWNVNVGSVVHRQIYKNLEIYLKKWPVIIYNGGGGAESTDVLRKIF